MGEEHGGGAVGGVSAVFCASGDGVDWGSVTKAVGGDVEEGAVLFGGDVMGVKTKGDGVNWHSAVLPNGSRVVAPPAK